MENKNLHNILSTIILNQSSLYSKIINGGDKEIFYLNSTEFDETPAASGLYLNNEGEAKFWNGNEYEHLSIEITNEFDNNNIELTSGYIPTAGAVYDFVNERNFGIGRTWNTLTSITSGTLVPSISNGIQQKITVTGDLYLYNPMLNSTYYSLTLQLTKSTGQTIYVNSSSILDSSTSGTYLIKWYFDGENTYRLEPIKVY